MIERYVEIRLLRPLFKQQLALLELQQPHARLQKLRWVSSCHEGKTLESELDDDRAATTTLRWWWSSCQPKWTQQRVREVAILHKMNFSMHILNIDSIIIVTPNHILFQPCARQYDPRLHLPPAVAAAAAAGASSCAEGSSPSFFFAKNLFRIELRLIWSITLAVGSLAWWSLAGGKGAASSWCSAGVVPSAKHPQVTRLL